MAYRTVGCMLLVLALGPATVQESGSSVAAFRDAPKAQKISSLNKLATHRESPSPEAIGAIISAGLGDSDEAVRTAAVSAAAGRAAGARFGRTPEALARWRVERPVIDDLRGPLLQAVHDSSAKVRQGAIVALVNCEYDPDMSSKGILLRDDLAESLASQFDQETDPSVRVEIVKTFALTSSAAARRNALLNKALQDGEAQVVAYGVMGFAHSTGAVPMEAIIALLKHADTNVRLQVAQTVASRGVSAKEYLPQLQSALAIETESAVRSTLTAAIRTLSGVR